jgi:hypothetical protein
MIELLKAIYSDNNFAHKQISSRGNVFCRYQG